MRGLRGAGMISAKSHGADTSPLGDAGTDGRQNGQFKGYLSHFGNHETVVLIYS